MKTIKNTIGHEIAPSMRGVDWHAVLLAAAAAGTVTLVLLMFFVPWAAGAGNAATVLRYLASVVAGPDVLPPPATITPAIALTAVLVHMTLSLWMTAIIAFVLHRGGFLTGVLGGALFGLFFFAVHYYSLTLFMPHMFALSHWSVALIHAIFGALAGGIYEILEYEPGEAQILEGH